MLFEQLMPEDTNGIVKMSAMATEIVREHFDPIIGKAQNDYMLQKFQTVDAITDQLRHGYQYYFVAEAGRMVGFLAFFPRENVMYLSKLYLYKEERGKGYARHMLDFMIRVAQDAEVSSIELNVNRNNSAIYAYEKLGFKVIRTEKNDIGEGYFMDDYVYSLKI